MFPAGHDRKYGSLMIDSAAVDYGTGAVGLDDLIFRRKNLPPDGILPLLPVTR